MYERVKNNLQNILHVYIHVYSTIFQYVLQYIAFSMYWFSKLVEQVAKFGNDFFINQPWFLEVDASTEYVTRMDA